MNFQTLSNYHNQMGVGLPVFDGIPLPDPPVVQTPAADPFNPFGNDDNANDGFDDFGDFDGGA